MLKLVFVGLSLGGLNVNWFLVALVFTTPAIELYKSVNWLYKVALMPLSSEPQLNFGFKDAI